MDLLRHCPEINDSKRTTTEGTDGEENTGDVIRRGPLMSTLVDKEGHFIESKSEEEEDYNDICKRKGYPPDRIGCQHCSR